MQPSHNDPAAAEPEELPAALGFSIGMQALPPPVPFSQPMPATGSWSVPAGAPAAKDTALFDNWVRRELVRLHGSVLQEPIPDRLRRIIEGGADPAC